MSLEVHPRRATTAKAQRRASGRLVLTHADGVEDTLRIILARASDDSERDPPRKAVYSPRCKERQARSCGGLLVSQGVIRKARQ